MRCDPIILKSVVNKAGKSFEVPSANCQQVIPAEVADRVTDILRGPFRSGTARSANIPGYNIAGKTGTDTGTPTIWTVGFTPQLVGAATLTVDPKADRYKDLKYDNRSLTGAPVRDGKARLRGSSGGEAGAGIWKPAMSAALEGLPRGHFVKPTPRSSSRSSTCRAARHGPQRVPPATAGRRLRHLDHKVENARPRGHLPRHPPQGRAPQFSTIRLLVSSGPAPKPEPTGAALRPAHQRPGPPPVEPPPRARARRAARGNA